MPHASVFQFVLEPRAILVVPLFAIPLHFERRVEQRRDCSAAHRHTTNCTEPLLTGVDGRQGGYALDAVSDGGRSAQVRLKLG